MPIRRFRSRPNAPCSGRDAPGVTGGSPMIRVPPYRRFKNCLLLLAAAVMAFVVAPQAAHSQSQPIHLRYGQAYSAQRSIFALPMLLAERRGYFLREGLDFHMVPVPGGGTKMI